ncbi:MAG: SpoIIE family protein phosphatase [Acidobacteriaceae bacterium]
MRKIWLTLLMWPLVVLPISAQRGSDISTNIPAASVTPAAPVVHLTLGSAFLPLTGPWKFHIGDNMAWADPNFDDSDWGTMDLASSSNVVDPNTGARGYVPGWTAHGYPEYSGYAWYRLRVDIQGNEAGGAHEALAIRMPDEFDDAYQIYVNGERIGQFGRFTNRGVTYYVNQPVAFSLPANLPTGPVTIAVRMWMDPVTALLQQEAGGLHAAPDLGQAAVIDALLRLHWEALYHREASLFLEMAVQPLAVLIAFCLLWFDRGELAYLWLGLSCLVSFVFLAVFTAEAYTTLIGGTSLAWIVSVVLPPIQDGLWILFWGYWFRLGRTVEMKWLYRITWICVLLLAVTSSMLDRPLYGRVIPIHAIVWLSPILDVLRGLLGLILVWVIYRGIRKDRTEGLLALPAAALVIVVLNGQYMRLLHVRTTYFFFGVYVPLGQIATVFSLGMITILMLRRFMHGQRQREQWKQEMEQARQVQSLLVPVTPPNTPGFVVESVYLPAQKVGGDFFQILPGEDGSLLIVMGDVSGKGLKAAMTVSTIVGALRNEKARQPADVLRHLNGVLHGQITGFVTCCAALISADGVMTIANAGHLAPYLNGKELTVEGGLPLGIVEAGSYKETTYALTAGDRLIFISDGVVEATNEKKELFGFERTQAISAQPAHDIATAAQAFGQEDDISVLSVTRTANLKAAVA